jgi:hypothetical protein
MVAEVAGNSQADVSRHRQSIVLASLAADLQLAGSPIDVTKFHSYDLARPKPQTRQQEYDSVVTGARWAVPLAGMDDAFDLFGAEVLRQFGELPLRHCRDGLSKVEFRLPAEKEVSKEGPQAGHHRLSLSAAIRAGVPQNETRDVLRGQVSDTDRCIPKAFDYETLCESPVVGNRYGGKTSFFLKVVLILSAECCQRRFIHYWFWRMNDAIHTQVVKELACGRGITILKVSFLASFFEEAVDDGLT